MATLIAANYQSQSSTAYGFMSISGIKLKNNTLYTLKCRYKWNKNGSGSSYPLAGYLYETTWTNHCGAGGSFHETHTTYKTVIRTFTTNGSASSYTFAINNYANGQKNNGVADGAILDVDWYELWEGDATQFSLTDAIALSGYTGVNDFLTIQGTTDKPLKNPNYFVDSPVELSKRSLRAWMGYYYKSATKLQSASLSVASVGAGGGTITISYNIKDEWTNGKKTGVSGIKPTITTTLGTVGTIGATNSSGDGTTTLTIASRGTTYGAALSGIVTVKYGGVEKTLTVGQAANTITIESVTGSPGTLTAKSFGPGANTGDVTATGPTASAVLAFASGGNNKVTINYGNTNSDAYGTWSFSSYSSTSNQTWLTINSSSWNKVNVTAATRGTTEGANRSATLTRTENGFTFKLKSTYGGASKTSTATSCTCTITQTENKITSVSLSASVSSGTLTAVSAAGGTVTWTPTVKYSSGSTSSDTSKFTPTYSVANYTTLTGFATKSYSASTGNYNFQQIGGSYSVASGEKFLCTIGSASVTSGNPAGYTILAYDLSESQNRGGVQLSNSKLADVITSNAADTVEFILYAGVAGATAGVAVTYSNLCISRMNTAGSGATQSGNKTTWASLGTTVGSRNASVTVSVKSSYTTTAVTATAYTAQAYNTQTLSKVYLKPYKPDASWIVDVSGSGENVVWSTCPASGGYVKLYGYANYSYTSGSSLNNQLITSNAEVTWSGSPTWITAHTNGGYKIASRGTTTGDARSSNATWIYNGKTSTAKTLTQHANSWYDKALQITASPTTIAAAGGTTTFTAKIKRGYTSGSETGWDYNVSTSTSLKYTSNQSWLSITNPNGSASGSGSTGNNTSTTAKTTATVTGTYGSLSATCTVGQSAGTVEYIITPSVTAMGTLAAAGQSKTSTITYTTKWNGVTTATGTALSGYTITENTDSLRIVSASGTTGTVTVTSSNNKSTSSGTFTYTISKSGYTPATISGSVAAGSKVYDTPTITGYTYATFAYAGATKTPTVSYSQTWTWNGVSDSGGTENSGGTLTFSMTASNGFTLGSTSTGSMTAAAQTANTNGANIVSRKPSTMPTVKVLLHGKTSSTYSCTACQQNGVWYRVKSVSSSSSSVVATDTVLGEGGSDIAYVKMERIEGLTNSGTWSDVPYSEANNWTAAPFQVYFNYSGTITDSTKIQFNYGSISRMTGTGSTTAQWQVTYRFSSNTNSSAIRGTVCALHDNIKYITVTQSIATPKMLLFCYGRNQNGTDVYADFNINVEIRYGQAGINIKTTTWYVGNSMLPAYASSHNLFGDSGSIDRVLNMAPDSVKLTINGSVSNTLSSDSYGGSSVRLMFIRKGSNGSITTIGSTGSQDVTSNFNSGTAYGKVVQFTGLDSNMYSGADSVEMHLYWDFGNW